MQRTLLTSVCLHAGAIAILLLGGAGCGGTDPQPTATPSPAPTPTAAPTWTPEPTITPILGGNGPYAEEPPLAIDPDGAHRATIRTEKGPIVIELLPGVAPRTVNSFVFLAREGFYDGLTFYRETPLLIQTGDPSRSGFGDAGYVVPLEKSDTPHEAGAVGLAHPNENPFGSSQFYIMRTHRPDLDFRYTVFGQVIEGMDVVNAIKEGDVVETIEIDTEQ
jgi:cyclophilin family peptidyl-prolyl cis-trans isomerase